MLARAKSDVDSSFPKCRLLHRLHRPLLEDVARCDAPVSPNSERDGGQFAVIARSIDSCATDSAS